MSGVSSPRIVDGKYELLRQLGEGGMGSVHEARHLGTGRRVALKLIARDALVKSPDIIARFEREARAVGHIESRHVAQVLDTGRDGVSGEPYLVLELLRGEDLAELVARVGPLMPDVALRILAQALAGLQCAHEAGIVHRDIKPANLFLSVSGGDESVVKILDFGIAKVRVDPFAAEKRDDVALTRTGSMLGSPLYMSPEQAKSAKNLDHRCDLWSMGVVLYEALSGTTPYDTVDSLGTLILEICSGRPRNVQQHAPWVLPNLAQVVYRALHPEIDRRYQSAAEMLADVRSLVTAREGLGPTALTRTMCVPVSPETRANVAIELSPGVTTLSPLASTVGASPTTAPMSNPEMLGSTLDAASANIPPAAPKRRSFARRIAAVVLTTGIIAGGAVGGARWFAVRAQSSASATPPIDPPRIDPPPAVSPAQAIRPEPAVAEPMSATPISSGAASVTRPAPTYVRHSQAATAPTSPPSATASALPTAPTTSGFSNNRHE